MRIAPTGAGNAGSIPSRSTVHAGHVARGYDEHGRGRGTRPLENDVDVVAGGES